MNDVTIDSAVFLLLVSLPFCHVVNRFEVAADFRCPSNGGLAISGV
jgi:hypothetical protein